MKFQEKLKKIVQKNNSLLCVGLDIDKEKIPNILIKENPEPYLTFNKKIIEYTKDLVCAYKINMAFYEVMGIKGIKTLEKTIKTIPKNIIIIIDGKRNDIGNTAKKYAQTIYETYKADATTINPYLGLDSIQPFLEYKNKCNFILCRTSNPSAKDFQDLKINNTPLYQIIAKKAKEWNKDHNCGLVVGATYPNELKTIRKIIGQNTPILIPGIGAQGGDIQQTVINGTNNKSEMALINSSRNIIYAGKTINYFEKAREQAKQLRDKINFFR